MSQLVRVEMMRKKAATHQVERCVRKRKGERVADYAVILPCMICGGGISPGQMRTRHVQQSHIQCDSASCQSLPDNLRHLARPGRDFQERKVFDSGCLSHAIHHLLRS
jgi:hypothetical protein